MFVVQNTVQKKIKIKNSSLKEVHLRPIYINCGWILQPASSQIIFSTSFSQLALKIWEKQSFENDSRLQQVWSVLEFIWQAWGLECDETPCKTVLCANINRTSYTENVNSWILCLKLVSRS